MKFLIIWIVYGYRYARAIYVNVKDVKLFTMRISKLYTFFSFQRPAVESSALYVER